MRPRKTIPHSFLHFLDHPSDPPTPRIDPSVLTQAAHRLGRCTSAHVLEHLGLPVTRANEMAVAKHLRGLGYIKARVRVDGSLHWVFFPPQDVTS